jgi:hypothetical protein
MEKMLPLNLNVNMNINCFDVYRLSIILSNTKSIPWFIERFINLQVDEHFECNYYDLGATNPTEYEFIFDEVLSISKVNSVQDILKMTIEALKNNKYLLITLNQRYFREDYKINEIDSVHGTLIVGFDEIEQKLFYLSNVRNKWCVEFFYFSELKQSFFSALNIIAKDDHINDWLPFLNRVNEPLSIIELKNNNSREVRFNILYDTFKNYLNGVESKARVSTFSRWQGIAIYKAYYEALNEILINNNPNDYFKPFRIHNIEIGMRRILENKAGISYRLKYLELTYDIKFERVIFQRLEKITKTLEIAVALYSKFLLTSDIKNLEKANIYLKEAEELDVLIFSQLADTILNYMKSGLISMAYDHC